MQSSGQSRVLVSQREFARLRNCNPGMVAKWKRRGVLVMDGGLVDVAASIEAIQASRNPAKAHMEEVNARQRAKHRGGQGVNPGVADGSAGSVPGRGADAALGDLDDEDGSDFASRSERAAVGSGNYPPSDDGQEIRVPGSGQAARFMDAKTTRERALAQIAVIELAERAGKVVDKEGVQRAAQGFGRMLRDAVLGVSSRIAPRLAGMTDALAIETLLDTELRTILTDIAKLGDADLIRALAGATETH